MLQTYACIQYIVSDTQCTNKAKHSEMGPVRQNTIQRTVRSVHVCALHCAQLLHAILLRTDLIIFPLTLQIISKAIRRRLQLVLISHSPQHTNTMKINQLMRTRVCTYRYAQPYDTNTTSALLWGLLYIVPLRCSGLLFYENIWAVLRGWSDRYMQSKLFIVAATAWYAETYHLLFCVCVFVGHAVNEIDEIQHIDRGAGP